MRSIRYWSCGALLGLVALWSGCGGVADPGPLTGYEDDGDGGSTGVSSGGTSGSNGEAGSEGSTNGESGREGMDPELGLDSNGGRSSGGGTGGAGAGDATGGSDSGAGGFETGAGGTDTGSGGTEPGTGGTDTGSGGTEPGTGGTDPGTGGTEQGIGGTDPGTGGTDPGTGGTDSGSGGTTGDGGTGGDVAQGGSGQGGSDEPPPIVDVEVGECAPFEPCGGDVEGAWTYTSACVDLDDLGLSEDAIDEMCPGAELTLEGQVTGILTFEDGVVTRQGSSSAQGEMFVPALCAVVLGGCAGVEEELEAAGLAGAACVSQGIFLPSCTCSFEIDAPEIDEVGFVTDGDVIVLEDGRELAYCAAGDSLTYAELGAGTEPGVRELTRR